MVVSGGFCPRGGGLKRDAAMRRATALDAILTPTNDEPRSETKYAGGPLGLGPQQPRRGGISRGG